MKDTDVVLLRCRHALFDKEGESPEPTRERHPGPIREKWAVRPNAQDEHPHVGQRRLGIESEMRSLILCDSLKKAF